MKEDLRNESGNQCLVSKAELSLSGKKRKVGIQEMQKKGFREIEGVELQNFLHDNRSTIFWKLQCFTEVMEEQL